MIKSIKFFIIISINLLSVKANAVIEVDITRGNLNPLPIAVSPIFSDKTSKEALKKELKIEDVGKKFHLLLKII